MTQFLRQIGIFVFVAVWCVTSRAQQFDDFTTLKSGGQIPKDFTTLSAEKYAVDYEANSDDALDKDFFLSTRFFIDELLLSGLVLFNEPLSDYLNEVVDYTLAKDVELRKSLHFYVLKSNVVNAFSTDQGIIIFTTGLLAQLENEAQLAFIIAHEVSHYKLKHVRKGYIEHESLHAKKGAYKNLDYDSKIRRLSIYNKENELEADAEGVGMYLQTNYPISEIYTTFDVLLFSDLPFDDIIFNQTFFNTDLMHVPESFFPDTIREISTESDYNDDGKTHPNIETRLNTVAERIGDPASEEGKQKFIVSEERFEFIRDLARFEGINLMLSEREYGNALYANFLLRKKFSENKFLDLTLLKAMYGLTKYKNHRRYEEVTSSPKGISGESYPLHVFLRSVTKPQLNVMAFRLATDLMAKYPDDVRFKNYQLDLKRELALNSGLVPGDLKNKSYLTALDSASKITVEIDYEAELEKIESSETFSKAEKIKFKKELQDVKSGQSRIKDADFHLYALSDCVANGLVNELKEIKNVADSISSAEIETKNKVEKFKGLGLHEIVIVDPIVEVNSVRKRKSKLKSEEQKVKIGKMYSQNYKSLDLHTTVLDSKNLIAEGVDQYNALGLTFQWASEVFAHDNIDMISSTNDQMKDLSVKYGTSHYLFSAVLITSEMHKFSAKQAAAILFWPYIPFALYDLLAIHRYLDMVSLVVDADQDKIVFVNSVSVKVNGREYLINNYIYDVLRKISKEPRKKV